MPRSPRKNAAWFLWFALVLGMFNSCAGHRESQASGKWLEAGNWPISPATLVRAMRALGTDDADLQRYHSYANAVLGLPYQATFVRPAAGWRIDARLLDEKVDASDPALTPPVVPDHPLVPYRDFLVEYPPGFFLFAIPPALVAHGVDSYSTVFAAMMGLLLTWGLALLADAAKRLGLRSTSSLVFFTTLCALAVGPVLVRRYDAVVSFSLCLLVWGCVTRRAWAVGLGFGLGMAAKGMPLLLAPLVLLYLLSEKRRKDVLISTLLAGGVCVAAVVPFLGQAGAHMLDMFAYHGQRPLQVESTGGALLVFGRLFRASFADSSQTYGSMNVVGAWDGPLKALASILPLAAWVAVGVVTWQGLRRAASDEARARVLLRGACAALAFFMVLGKVFSPQYLTWLLPLGMLATLVDGRPRAKKTIVGALVLTQVIWPFSYCIGLASNLSPVFGALVLARNSLVFAWAWQMVRGPRAEDTALGRSPARDVPIVAGGGVA
jgi:hypothetical protein